MSYVYFVEIESTTDGFESRKSVLASSISEDEAKLRALLNQCHGSIEEETISVSDDGMSVEDMTSNTTHEIKRCEKVDADDVDTLLKYFNVIL
jgi:hypothetical protein